MAATAEKARRLATEGRVHALTDARVFAVEGDDGIYLVVVTGRGAHCTCPAERPSCSHILAARERAGR